jgi:SNF2 family DNA or RNA helicase
VYKRQPQDIKDWNEGKIKMLVTHPASAGHGLNLQFGGTNLLWYGCPWSLEQYLQGIKRVHRNGVAGVVTNTRLIVKNTIDEDVIQTLESKDKVQEAMIKAVRARIEKYTK